MRHRELAVVLLGCVSIVAACAAPAPEITSDPRPLGPLAVALAGNGNKARTEGVLRITDTCTFLVNQNDRSLPIWPSLQTVWEQASQTILFSDRDGQLHRLADGQRVAFGGSGGGEGEGPPGQLDRLPWVVRPMPECAAPAFWFVGGLAN